MINIDFTCNEKMNDIDFTCNEKMNDIDFTYNEKMNDIDDINDVDDMDEVSFNNDISHYLIKEYGGKEITNNNLLYLHYPTRYQIKQSNLLPINTSQKHYPTRYQIKQSNLLPINTSQKQKPIPPYLNIKYPLLKLQCSPFHKEYLNKLR